MLAFYSQVAGQYFSEEGYSWSGLSNIFDIVFFNQLALKWTKTLVEICKVTKLFVDKYLP